MLGNKCFLSGSALASFCLVADDETRGVEVLRLGVGVENAHATLYDQVVVVDGFAVRTDPLPHAELFKLEALE